MLRGEKATLRAATQGDVVRLARFENDLGFVLAGGGDPPEPAPLERLQRDFDGEISEPRRQDRGRHRGRRGYLGRCGLYDIDRTALHAEIGNREHWGRGHGREAVGLLLDYAFRLRDLRRVWPEVHSANERGIRAYRSCGFVEEGRRREHVWPGGRYADNVVTGVPREEWGGAGKPGRSGNLSADPA